MELKNKDMSVWKKVLLKIYLDNPAEYSVGDPDNLYQHPIILDLKITESDFDNAINFLEHHGLIEKIKSKEKRLKLTSYGFKTAQSIEKSQIEYESRVAQEKLTTGLFIFTAIIAFTEVVRLSNNTDIIEGHENMVFFVYIALVFLICVLGIVFINREYIKKFKKKKEENVI